MFVNYVKEHEAFIEFASDNGLSANERLLWYALIHIFNSRAQGKVWPGGFIRIANKRLLSFLPMQFDAMAKARHSLKQRGLIDFEHGKRNKEMPMYRMRFFSAEEAPTDTSEGSPPVENDVDNMDGKARYPSSYPFLTDNTRGNNGGNIQGNNWGNTQGNNGDIIYKHKQGVNGTKTYFDDDDEEDAAFTRARTQAREIVRQSFRAHFGRSATEAEADCVAQCVLNFGLSLDLIDPAVRMAARNGAKTPAAYIRELLSNWQFNHVNGIEDLGEYQFLADCAWGKHPGMMGSSEAYEAIRERRRVREEQGGKGTNDDGTDA